MEQILGTIGDALGSVFSSPILQFGIRAHRHLPGHPLAGHGLLGVPRHAAAVGQRDPAVPRVGRDHPVHADLLRPRRSGSTRSSGRTRRSARSGSATWPRRRSWPRSRRSTTAPPASAGSTTNGSSARPAGRGSTASARTAAGWSGWTGRCAPGAARTSSDARSSAANLEPLPGGREATGRIAATAETPLAASTAPARSAPASGRRVAAVPLAARAARRLDAVDRRSRPPAQDPLPER